MFTFSEKHIVEHMNDGITVFQNIIPATLVSDLRKEAEKSLALANKIHGEQAQRIQPVGHYGDVFNLQVFKDYEQLPALNDAIHKLLGDDSYYNNLDLLGILVGPPARTNCMQWHMDLSESTAGVDSNAFKNMRNNPRMGNQANCPLYQDNFLWFLPGSHNQPAQAEHKAIANSDHWDTILESLLQGDACEVALERECLRYLYSMPGGVRMHLNPGDFALYRPFAWHGAFYPAYQRRATLHHGVWTPESFAWWTQMNEARGSWRDRYEKPVTADEL